MAPSAMLLSPSMDETWIEVPNGVQTSSYLCGESGNRTYLTVKEASAN